MKSHQALKKLQKLVSADLPEIERNSIIRDGQDIIAFKHYRIIPYNGMFRVVKWDNIAGEFSSTRLALSWCIADRYQKPQPNPEISRDSANSKIYYRPIYGQDLRYPKISSNHSGVKT